MINNIYFVDDNLSSFKYFEKVRIENSTYSILLIEAGNGISHNLESIDRFQKDDFTYNILTNDVNLLSYHYKSPNVNGVEIFIYREDKFVNIRSLTDKDLRPAHNIPKMYIAGSFNK